LSLRLTTRFEPATSGVTGQFSVRYMRDDRAAMPPITSAFGPVRSRPHGCIDWSGTLAALLLPGLGSDHISGEPPV